MAGAPPRDVAHSAHRLSCGVLPASRAYFVRASGPDRRHFTHADGCPEGRWCCGAHRAHRTLRHMQMHCAICSRRICRRETPTCARLEHFVDPAMSARRCFPRMYGSWDRRARRSEPSRWVAAVAAFRDRRRLVHRCVTYQLMRRVTRRPTCRVTRPAC